MNLFKRKTNDTTAIPEDLQPYYSNQSNGVRRWIGPILRAILLLVLLGLLVWGGLALVNRVTGDDDNNETNAGSSSQNIASNNKSTPEPKTTATPAPTPKPTPTPTPTPTPAPSPTPTATPTPTSTATPTAAGAPSQLVNSGPGETALLLFVTVSAVAAFGYHRHLARRS